MKMYQDSFSVERKLDLLKFDWVGKSVVDMGCNIGRAGLYVLQHGAADYIGIEANHQFIVEGWKRYPQLKLLHNDVLDIAYDCDVLMCMAIFHHMKSGAVVKLLKQNKFEWLIMEVPVGDRPLKNYYIRPESWYIGLLNIRGYELVQFTKNPKPYPVQRDFYVFKKKFVSV